MSESTLAIAAVAMQKAITEIESLEAQLAKVTAEIEVEHKLSRVQSDALVALKAKLQSQAAEINALKCQIEGDHCAMCPEIAKAKEVITKQAKISCKNDTLLWALRDAVLSGDYLAANYIAQQNDATGDLNTIIINLKEEIASLKAENEKLRADAKAMAKYINKNGHIFCYFKEQEIARKYQEDV